MPYLLACFIGRQPNHTFTVKPRFSLGANRKPPRRTRRWRQLRCAPCLTLDVRQKIPMTSNIHHCPLCGNLLIAVESALNRTWGNALLTAFGSSQLQIRMKNKRWMPFMSPSRSAAGLYCSKCGSLTIAPSIPAHRRELGLDT